MPGPGMAVPTWPVVGTQQGMAHVSPTSRFTSYRSVHPEARGHLSEALTEDTGVGTSVAGSPLPLTTGNESLDIAIVRHLQYCTQLVQVGCQADPTGTGVRGLLMWQAFILVLCREMRIQE